MKPTKKIVFCYTCGRPQEVNDEVRQCPPPCGSLVFVPQAKVSAMVDDGFVPKDPIRTFVQSHLRTEFPVWTERDLEFLKVTRISPE